VIGATARVIGATVRVCPRGHMGRRAGIVRSQGGAHMTRKAAISVHRSRDEVQRLWQSSDYRPEYIEGADAAVEFRDAPGDRGTEIHVDLEHRARGGKLGELVQKVTGTEPLAKVKDDLRRFKQLVETGEIARSDGTPEGERAERKPKQRPAQPLEDNELDKAGV
jgi:uncharacterized membrane protein